MAKFVLFLIAAAALLVLGYLTRKQRRKPAPLATLKLQARRPLTPFEEQMFKALTASLPECVVLAQVALSALVTTNQRRDRNRFDRKVADFLICSKQLTPIAVIELDDSSHNNKRAQDVDRDAMLRNAGYQTIRYSQIPSKERVQADVEATLQTLTANSGNL